jgi:RNA polymerase-binding transcription factor DksA
MLSKEFIEEMRSKLLEEKQRLTEDMAAMTGHTEVGEDYDENATEVQIDDMHQDMSGRMKADLDKIEIALSKIDAGTYGTDDEGNEIPEDRLRAIPWASTNI